MPEVFYDAVTPSNIPDRAAAVLYLDGDFAATEEETRRLGPVRWNTVLGNPAAGAADIEPGNEVYSAAVMRSWAAGRRAMGCRARAYTDRADFKRAWELIGSEPNVIWWIATLDGNPHWTAESLATNILAETGVKVSPSLIWGCQYNGGVTARFDTSLLFGRW